MRQEMMLTMSRMSCIGCVKNTTRALQALHDVEVIATDLPTKTVHLGFDSEHTTLDTIKTTLATAKYPVASEQAIDQLSQEATRTQ